MNTSQKKVIKQTFIEAQLKGAGLDTNLEILGRLEKEAGYNWKVPAKEYPLDTIQAISLILIQEYMKTGKTWEQALYQLGEEHSIGFRGTIIGRVAFSASHLMKPLKLIERILDNFNVITNYGERTVTEISPTHLRIVMKDEPAHPEWLRGLFEASLTVSNLKNPKLRVTVLAQDYTQIDIIWS
jgi:uncharacterized protein (TIGR02265 family)